MDSTLLKREASRYCEFLSWVINSILQLHQCEKIGPEFAISQDQASILSDQTKQWNKSYRNLTKDRFGTYDREDLANLKPADQVQEFDRSQPAQDAIRIIEETEEGENEVRDLLLIIICINNGSKAGTLANRWVQGST